MFYAGNTTFDYGLGGLMVYEENAPLLHPGMELCHGYTFIPVSSILLAYFGGDGPGSCPTMSFLFNVKTQVWTATGAMAQSKEQTSLA